MNLASRERRLFLEQCVAAAAAWTWIPWAQAADRRPSTAAWLETREDPLYALFPGDPDLDKILALYPRTTGKPACDPQVIAENLRRLKTTPEVDTGHPFLDLSVKTGLAHIDATFQGDHPKYGVDSYGTANHDAFPPTIIAAVDALSAWGLGVRAAQLFRYWLRTFVRRDGTIEYTQRRTDATSIAEYGQLLHTAALLEERAGQGSWWADGLRPLDRIAQHLLKLHAEALKDDGLIPGVPEADIANSPGKFFHNNAWAAKGLQRWAALCERAGVRPTTTPDLVRKAARRLADDTLAAIRKTWPADESDWWLPPQLEARPRPAKLTGANERHASYTNYRYWPELLSSGLLPPSMANRLVNARLSAGGQFCGMTRFTDHLDDWPLADYLHGLWALGRKRDFLMSLYGHVAYHQAEGHLTAYEQVTFPPGEAAADYCLACQLVAARAARLLVP
jgi:hypothetical protein